MNLYAFCRNNGVNGWDYLGMGFDEFGIRYTDPKVSWSWGVSGTVSGTASPGLAGIHGEGTFGAGYFSNVNGNQSLGAFYSYGVSAGPLGILSQQTLQQGGGNMAFNPSAGLYAGANGAVWISNAGSVRDLSLTATTYSLNVAIAGAQLGGISYSSGGGIWQLSISPPAAGAGHGLDLSAQATNTNPVGSTSTAPTSPTNNSSNAGPSSGAGNAANSGGMTGGQSVGDRSVIDQANANFINSFGSNNGGGFYGTPGTNGAGSRAGNGMDPGTALQLAPFVVNGSQSSSSSSGGGGGKSLWQWIVDLF